MSAIREERPCASSPAPVRVPSISPTAIRTRRSVASSRFSKHFAHEQPFRRLGRHVAQKLGERALERLRHLQKDKDRRVADAIFEIGEMPLGDVRRQRQRLAGHAAAGAQCAHALAERDQERLLRASSAAACIATFTPPPLGAARAKAP